MVDVTTPTSDQQATPWATPDYSAIIYLQRVLGGDLELRRVDRNGANDVLLETGHHRLISISPDGQYVIYSTYNSGEEDTIWRVDAADGANRVALYTNPIGGNYLNRAIYSPDGTMIAFTDEDAETVWVMEDDGSNAVEVDAGPIDTGTSNEAIAWANASDRIAYGDGQIGGDFVVIDADGSNRTVVGSQFNFSTYRSFLSRWAWVPGDTDINVEMWTDEGILPDSEHLHLLDSGGGGGADLSPTFRNFDGPSLVVGDRIYALAYGEPYDTEPLTFDSVNVDGSDRRVEDPDGSNILLEYFE